MNIIGENLGTDWLTIHLEKACSACMKELKMLNDEAGAPRSDPADEQRRVERPGQENAVAAQPDPYNRILEQGLHGETWQVHDFQIFPPFLTIREIQSMNEEQKKQRRITLFNDRTFQIKNLIRKNENGTTNYDELIDHIKFLEECIKDLKTVHQAAELVKINFINEASTAERYKIKESDRKYIPKYEEREEAEKIKMTAEEKKIQAFIRMGLSREAAEKIIFAKG